MAQIKALQVPLSERPFCIGKAELMGYLGISSEATLNANYLNKGLRAKVIGRQLYYYKKDIDRFLVEHNENPIK